jgi:hypothetical protein
VRLAREAGDEPRLAIALSKAGHSRFLMGDQERAIELERRFTRSASGSATS